MSARKKVQGNAAVHCDEPGCAAVVVADSWTANAAQTRSVAILFRGWTRDYRARKDFCPDHLTSDPAYTLNRNETVAR